MKNKTVSLFVASMACACLAWSAPESSEITRSEWVQKAAKKLRYAGPITSKDELKKLLALTDAEILEIFLQDKRFANTALDFNLYYLGFPTSSLMVNDQGITTYDFRALSVAPAIVSAQEVMKKDGDYFALFDEPHVHFLHPVERVELRRKEGEKKPPVDREKRKEIRKKQIDFFSAKVDALSAYVKDLGDKFTKKQFCVDKKAEFEELAQHVQELFIKSGFSFSQEYRILERLFLYSDYCTNDSLSLDLVKALEDFKAFSLNYVSLADKTDPEVYAPIYPNEILSIPSAPLGTSPHSAMWGFEFWSMLQNSSTNMNRKRGAFVLSNYFCDDLTPIGFVAPEEHAEGKHASEASCYACHFKLDPMAGFFRNIGFFGFTSETNDTINFDDGVKMKKADYEKNWFDPSGIRKFNIGMIRSTTNPKLNTYGESIKELFAILKSAPEVKSCLVKKMARYFLGENLTLDQGYLDHLTQMMLETAAEKPSTEAFRSVVKKLLTSQTFRQKDLRPESCYDFAPGTSLENRPPCKIAAILEANCTSCHKSTSENGNLNLTKWVELSPKVFGFLHLDETGKPIARNETLRQMLDRISSPDPTRQMPFKKHMKATDRASLFKWLTEESQ